MPRSNPDRTVRRILWWLCLLVAPAVLIAIELYHPAGFTEQPGMYQFLSYAEPQAHHSALDYFGPQWWFTLHMIQTPMIGLVAVGLWLMVEDIDSGDGTAAMTFAWLARAATLVFLVYYTVLDAIGGIGLGQTLLTVQNLADAGELDLRQVEGITVLLNTVWADPVIGGVGSLVSRIGSWAAFATAVFAAAALVLADRAGWANMVPLLGFGWELQVSHASPHGPIAFGLLIVAAGWLRWSRSRRVLA
jgi:hypothetical protein